MSGNICTKVYNLLAIILKCNISWQKKYSRVSNFTNKEISIICRVQIFANFVNFTKYTKFCTCQVNTLTYYCQPNVQCAVLHKGFSSQSFVKTIGLALTILLLEKLLTIYKLKKSIPIFQYLYIQLVAVSAIISLLHVV